MLHDDRGLGLDGRQKEVDQGSAGRYVSSNRQATRAKNMGVRLEDRGKSQLHALDDGWNKGQLGHDKTEQKKCDYFYQSVVVS